MKYTVLRKISSIDLLCSIHCLQGHISKPENDPSEFGWKDIDANLLPDRQLLPLPSYFNVRYSGKKIYSYRSTCIRSNTGCAEFCKCKQNCSNNP